MYKIPQQLVQKLRWLNACKPHKQLLVRAHEIKEIKTYENAVFDNRWCNPNNFESELGVVETSLKNYGYLHQRRIVEAGTKAVRIDLSI